MQEKVFFTNASGQRLCALVERSPALSKQKAIILLHGFGSHKTSYRTEANARFFEQLGFAVFRADFRGRGESEGDISYSTTTAGLEDASAMLDWLLAQPWADRENIVLWGNSYGGGVALLLAARRHEFRAVMLISPAIEVQEMYRYVGYDIEEWRRNGFIEMLNQKRHISLYDDGGCYDPYADAAAVECPLLIVHGDKDEYVPLEQSRRVHHIVSGSELSVVKGADHSYKAGTEDVYCQVWEAVKNWLLKQGLVE